MEDLVTLDQAKKALGLTGSTEDDLLRMRLAQAQAIVVDHVRQRYDEDVWTAEVEAWTEETVPPQVQAAICLQCAELYRFRGDDTDGPVREPGQLSSSVVACLARLRDPAFA